jgi:hypothetical protein
MAMPRSANGFIAWSRPMNWFKGVKRFDGVMGSSSPDDNVAGYDGRRISPAWHPARRRFR